MNVQSVSSYSTTKRKITLSVQELVALKDKWLELKEQISNEIYEEELKDQSINNLSAMEEMDVFFNQFLIEVLATEEVHQELFVVKPTDESMDKELIEVKS